MPTCLISIWVTFGHCSVASCNIGTALPLSFRAWTCASWSPVERGQVMRRRTALATPRRLPRPPRPRPPRPRPRLQPYSHLTREMSSEQVACSFRPALPCSPYRVSHLERKAVGVLESRARLGHHVGNRVAPPSVVCRLLVRSGGIRVAVHLRQSTSPQHHRFHAAPAVGPCGRTHTGRQTTC
jgi:hypothetical protein